MNDYAGVIGVDAGGTKLHIRVATAKGDLLVESVLPNAGWSERSMAEKASVIAAAIEDCWTGTLSAAGVGAHGCDSEAECTELQTELEKLLPCPVRVVNDAALLRYLLSEPADAALVLGTGSILVASKPGKPSTYVGGWGWLLGDDGAAWGVVRNAVRLLTETADQDGPPDPLLGEIAEATGHTNLRTIVDVMQREPAAKWASWAPLVFRAAINGSAAASEALELGVTHSVELVRKVTARGIDIRTVVAGGSVITHQSDYAQRIHDRLLSALGITLTVVDRTPVSGAIQLAIEHLLEVGQSGISSVSDCELDLLLGSSSSGADERTQRKAEDRR